MDIFVIFGVVLVFIVVMLSKALLVVQQRSVCVVERLGKYSATLSPGLHFLIPFVDRVAYRHSLKELVVDVPSQPCITRDNISVDVDGIIYMQVLDPVKASYGVTDFLFACAQLAQTTMRSEIGKLELDRTFEERSAINSAICDAVDRASDPWGIKVTRYEIRSITPPVSILGAMEKQVRAEREKRAIIAESEGARQACINRAEGDKQETVARSEGERIKRVNEAEGRSSEIKLIANATAEGIHSIAAAIRADGGADAVNLRLAEQYISEFGKLAKANNTMIIPSDLSNIAGLVKSVSTVLKQ